MKKAFPYIITGVLCAALAGGIVFCLMNSNDKNNNRGDNKDSNYTEVDKDKNNENNSTEKVILKSTEMKNSKIVQTFEISMNGKKVLFNVDYTDKAEKLDSVDAIDGIEGLETLEGKINDITLNSSLKNIADMEHYKKVLFEKSVIDKIFTTRNFRIIKGSDNKDYLLVNTQIQDNFNFPVANYLYIFNDTLELINNTLDSAFNGGKGMMIHNGPDSILSSEVVSYENDFGYSGLTSKNIRVKIMNNKILYQYSVLSTNNSDSYGNIEEREYTISNNKLEYKVLGTHKADDITGQLP